MNDIQKISIYSDKLTSCNPLFFISYPFLAKRKAIWLFLKKISYYCHCIIKNSLFEFLTLCIIFTHSIVLAIEDPTAEREIW